MGPEVNIDAIRALEKQIVEGDGDTTELKRDRNSLLNISTRVPPEILGDIFAWRLVREWQFQGLQRGSYNFLLVCHHWFEVASQTPELWSYWGNTFQDWKKRYHRSGTTPLDLVLDGDMYYPGTFDKSLRNAVRNRVMQDTVRQVHLMADKPFILKPIISLLTPDDGGGQNENIRSIILHSGESATLDVSNFFARSRLSRLRSLDLHGRILISSWDRLIPRTTLLTTLSLDITIPSPSPPPTAAQLFSILTSNPNLQELFLTNTVLPNDADTSTFKVQLCHLKLLSLMGEFRHLFGLLRQLTLPEMLDDLYLTVFNPTVEDISQTFAPYMRDYFRRDPWFRDRLGVSSASSRRSVSFSVGVASTKTTAPFLELPQVSITTFASPNMLEQFFVDVIASSPRERVVTFEATEPDVPREVFFAMPNIGRLCIFDAKVSEGFLQPDPDGPRPNTKLLPSLRSLSLENPTLGDNGWDHLMTYLAHQTSDGQVISLEIGGSFPHLCLDVVKEVENLVEKFSCRQDPVTTCLLCRCEGKVRGTRQPRR